MNYQRLFLITLLFICLFSCKKEKEPEVVNASDNLAIDSLVATNKNIVVNQLITIKAYTRGNNLTFQWNCNHGLLFNPDSSTVKYFACASCVGLNTVECQISNEYGSIKDTIMINVSAR